MAASTKALHSLAKEVIHEHGGRWDDPAVRDLLKRVRKDPDAMKQALRYACEQMLYLEGRSYRSYARTQAEREGSMPRTYTKEQVEGARAVTDEWLLDMIMSDGKTRFRDATKALLLKEAEGHARLAAGSLLESRYRKAVARKLSEGQTVGQVWTEEKLRELRSRLKCKDGAHC